MVFCRSHLQPGTDILHPLSHLSLDCSINDREQEEDKRELGGRSCKRRRAVEAAHDQNVGSRGAEGVMEGTGWPRRGRSKSASPLSRLLRGFRDSNTH